MSEQIYTISGHVVDEQTGAGIPELQVEVWDSEHIVEGAVGFTLTGPNGEFQMSFTDSFINELFEGRPPVLFFKIFSGDTLLRDTEDSIEWNVHEGDLDVTITVPTLSYTATGHVIDEGTGEAMAGVRVELWDVDHRHDSAVATVNTNTQGAFQIDVTDSYLRGIYGDDLPPFFFQVFDPDGTLLVSTEETTHWNVVDEPTIDIDIMVPPEEEDMTYTVTAHVTDAESGDVIADVVVEMWDSTHSVSSAIVSATTGANGDAQLVLTDSQLEALFGQNIPPLFFKVIGTGGTERLNTEGSITWSVEQGSTVINLQVPPEEVDNTYNVTAHVIGDVTGTGIADLRVEAWDSSGTVTTAITSAVTGADGNCQLTFTDSQLEALFGQNIPPLFFKVFDSENTLLASTAGSVTWHPTNGTTTVEIVVPEEEGGENPGGGPIGSGQRGCGEVNVVSYTVTGTVSSATNAGLTGLQVRLYDKSVGDDYQLAQGVTDNCGKFSLTFDAEQITSRGKQRPDVQAKVYSGGTLVASSEVRYNAFGEETVDVVIPADATGLGSEHESLASALSTHYSGALRDLQENDTRKDITYLANKSGWDARAVAMAALSDQFSNQSTGVGGEGAIAPSYFYSLFRAGLPANENVLYHTDEGTLSAVWDAAAQQGVLRESELANVPNVLSRFRALSAQKLLSAPALVGASSMNDMLGSSGLNSTQKQQFASIYAAHRSDPEAFWGAVTSTFGASISQRLQLDGKLAYLTINNATLMTAIRTAIGGAFTDAVQLAQAGFHRASAWANLLAGDAPIPPEIPGADTAEKRANYGEYLAAKVRLSYPTATVAQMINSGEITVMSATTVETFLNQHQGSFEIGTQSVEQYIAENSLTVDETTTTELKRLQRVYQITPTDESMAGMLDNGLDAAAHVAQYDKDTFVDMFGDAVGGPENAEQIHERSVQIHNAVLNIALGYLTASNGIPLGTPPLDPNDPEGQATGGVLNSTPKGPGSVTLPGPLGAGQGPWSTPATDVLAYATLESLFGEMDYCACDHCRSILSPAAYLVDLLYFINKPSPPAAVNPLNIFLARRPDVQHLPLTCENTNTALPYIDVVNETLEYYVVNSLSLSGYLGHDTGKMKSEDLLASPVFVNDTAYTTLAGQRFPMPLPFHRPLESLRRHLEKFDVFLPTAMEHLRPHDNLERGGSVYGWRDILMEELQLSRGEYEIFTDTTAVPLWKMYGFAPATADATVIAGLSNAKKFCRRLDITYDELVELLKTRFINPNSDLIPKLEKLNVPFLVMKQLFTGAITPAAFNALLPTGAGAPDPANYGGNIATWVTTPANYNRIMALITLADINGADPCSFDTLELRFSNPMTGPTDTSTRITAVDYIRILRFIRLWKKTGWTMEQTDAVLNSLYRVDLAPITSTDTDTATELNTGFLTLLPRLGIIARLMRELDLAPKRDLLPLLALWSDIGTLGEGSLYSRMFLNPTILSQDPVYAADSNGAYLTNPAVMLSAHVESLRAAFNLTGEEYDRIVASLAYTGSTTLSIPNITRIFRHGYLARAMRISVQELLALMRLTGLDPFAAPDPTNPAVLRLVKLVKDLKELSLKPASALYYVWNQDLSGQSAPTTAQVNEFIRSLRDDLLKIDNEFLIADDPEGEIAQARMTLVYGADATAFFFGLLNDTFVSEASYSHVIPAFGASVASAIQTAAGTYGSPAVSRVSYDDFRKVLTFTGVLDLTKKNAIRAVATSAAFIAEVNAVAPGQLVQYQTDFQAAVDALYTANSTVVGPFFDRYAELLPLYQTFMNPLNTDPPATKRTTLLASFIPALVARYKTQRTLQRLADAAQTDRAFADAMVNASPATAGIHAAGDTANPAMKDLIAVERQGLSAQFYNAASIGPNPQTPRIDANLVYIAPGNPLPPNGVSPGSPISVLFTGSVEAPETGLYSIVVDADPATTVSMLIDGVAVPMTQSGSRWRNASQVALTGGSLYAIELTVLSVTTTLKIQWETAGRGLAPIAARLLYPSTKLTAVRDAYLRFLKGSAMASALKLTAAETARPAISGASWLNSLPVIGGAGSPSTLLPPLREILDYAVLKAALSPESDSLLTVVRNPATATATPSSLLFMLTGWDQTSLTAVLTRLGATISNLGQPGTLRRVYDAFELVRSMGIPASALIAATTNEPTATMVRDLQAALRARYAEEDWRTLVQPINDQMRGLQRDALVAYILHQLRSNPLTEHINTANKLFEYFLMDVQMEPCMQTSRIRHALSSVQLFIERCLMNLEGNVPAGLLNGDQWEWMKRYRVWEANRKVFLFPENWLEPELRDDKSPFFKEIESELLESDITEESATIAMLHYMAKLEEVAKLEPCGFYHIPADPVARTGEINHVVARTPGAYRKYYYRRREYGYWTAWEEIKLDIEDNPVQPIVWQDRLLLFWVKILKKGPDTTTGQKPSYTGSGGDLASINLPAAPKTEVQAVLCWSEYYNGKWQAPKSSDMEHPVSLATFDSGGVYAFNRSDLLINAIPEGPALRINVGGYASFLMYNTHSTPAQFPASYWPFYFKNRWQGNYDNDLTFTYGLCTNWLCYPGVDRQVLRPTLPYSVVLPSHPMAEEWNIPMFYQDKRHVFYVSMREEQIWVRDYPVYAIPATTGSTARAAIPATVTASAGSASTATSASAVAWPSGSLGSGFVSSGSITAGLFVSEDVNIHQAITMTRTVTYQGTVIGPTGSVVNLG